MNAPSALRDPPRTMPLRSRRPELDVGNLPSEINAFVGRERELARLRALQDECRLLSLVGPSGVGKTRLALKLAAEIADSFPDGAWIVDLSPITDPALVPQAVGDVLGVRHPTGQAWLDALARTLRAHRLLLVLDNCEHLSGACADLVERLLRSCPQLHVLATSLQPLGASGETTWRVPPLAVPAAGAKGVRELGDSEAVCLFVARVRARVPDFTLAESNAQLVAEVCRQLDGLPLALELVAARLESLGLAEVAVRLSDRFALARGDGRTRPARQRTLQAALDWSCSLLDLDELTLLRRLAVFVGGWTLEAAEAVCAGDELPAAGVADVLGRLVTKSLVVAQHVELRVRYYLLETVRTYALRQLAEAGERQSLSRQHAAFVLQLAERAEPMSLDAAQAASLEPEEGNVRAALEWTIQYQHAEVGLRLATASFSMWQHIGHYSEAGAWLERLLALSDSTMADATRANALTAYAQVVLLLGNFERAQTYAHAALEQHRADGDARGIGLALKVLGNVALQQGDLTRAAALHTDALRRLEEAGSRVDVISLTQLVVVACELGDTVRA
ncbi:MAG: AAA family ATPase, partial [Chloroflexi bacterium]|nr:AAA family ATPase [Chloroflexota bacterium]